MRVKGATYGRIFNISLVLGILVGIVFFFIGAILGTVGLTIVSGSFITGILSAFATAFVGAIALGIGLLVLTVILFLIGAIWADFLGWIDDMAQ